MDKTVTAESFAKAYPDIYREIVTKAYQKGHDEGFRKGHEEGSATGAEAERIRIREVEKMSVPGHEKLIEELKFDGKTTGPEAAVAVLKAEKDLREKKLEDFRKEDVSVKPADPDIAESKSKSRGDFEKMTAGEKAAFLKGGGKVIDQK